MAEPVTLAQLTAVLTENQTEILDTDLQQLTILEDIDYGIVKLNYMFKDFFEQQKMMQLKMLEALRESGLKKAGPKSGTVPSSDKKAEGMGALGVLGILSVVSGLIMGFVEEVVAQIGKAIKGIGKVIKFFTPTKLLKLFEELNLKITEWVKNLKTSFVEWFKNNALVKRIAFILDDIKVRIYVWADDLKKSFVSKFEALKTAFMESKFMKFLTSIKTSIVELPTKIKEFFKPLTAIFEMFSSGGGGIVSKIMESIGSVGTKITEIVGKFSPYFVKLGKLFGKLLGKLVWPIELIMAAIDEWGQEREGGILESAGRIVLEAINSFIFGFVDLIKDFVSWILEKLGFEDASEWLDSFSFKDFFSEVIDEMMNALNNFGKFIGYLAANILEMVPGVGKGFSAVMADYNPDTGTAYTDEEKEKIANGTYVSPKKKEMNPLIEEVTVTAQRIPEATPVATGKAGNAARRVTQAQELEAQTQTNQEMRDASQVGSVSVNSPSTTNNTNNVSQNIEAGSMSDPQDRKNLWGRSRNWR